MAETPLQMNQVCYGLDLRNYNTDKLRQTKKINIQWLNELYAAYPAKEKFFDYHQSKEMGNIDRLAGTSNFRKQIIAGVTDAEIRKGKLLLPSRMNRSDGSRTLVRQNSKQQFRFAMARG